MRVSELFSAWCLILGVFSVLPMLAGCTYHSPNTRPRVHSETYAYDDNQSRSHGERQEYRHDVDRACRSQSHDPQARPYGEYARQGRVVNGRYQPSSEVQYYDIDEACRDEAEGRGRELRKETHYMRDIKSAAGTGAKFGMGMGKTVGTAAGQVIGVTGGAVVGGVGTGLGALFSLFGGEFWLN